MVGAVVGQHGNGGSGGGGQHTVVKLLGLVVDNGDPGKIVDSSDFSEV